MPKKDDEVLVDIGEKVTEAQNFYQKNQNGILLGLGALIVLIGGLVFWKYNKEQKSAEAAIEIYESETAFAQDSFAQAIVGFEEVASSYGGTPSGNIANYYAGVASLQSGKFQEAIDFLEEYKPSNDVMKALKAGVLGDAYAEAGDLDQALSSYTTSANASNNSAVAPHFINKAALLSDKLGDKEASKGFFEMLKKDFPNSQEGKEALQYLARF